MTIAVVMLVSFVAMEGVTYCAHRWLMHGVGWILHRSHHRKLATRFEANDLFPVAFAGISILLFAFALQVRPLLPVFWGICLYGATYAFVHDVYIHQRLPVPRRLVAFLEPLRQAHLLHHRFNGEPYGMLIPYVPKKVRERESLLLNNRNGSR